MRRLLIGLAALFIVPSAADAQTWYGDWHLDTQRDAMTDQMEYTLATMELPNPKEGDGAVGLHCQTGSGSLVSIQVAPITMDDTYTVMVRFGSDEPRRITWNAKQQGLNTMVYSRSVEDVSWFVEEARAHAKLAVRDQEGQDYTFSLDGFTEAVSRAECLN